jgi:hypothetical protein
MKWWYYTNINSWLVAERRKKNINIRDIDNLCFFQVKIFFHHPTKYFIIITPILFYFLTYFNLSLTLLLYVKIICDGLHKYNPVDKILQYVSLNPSSIGRLSKLLVLDAIIGVWTPISPFCVCKFSITCHFVHLPKKIVIHKNSTIKI